jgi:formyl-CoA transferase
MRVFDAIGRPELKRDPRFATNEKRLENVDELDEIIQEWMADHTRKEAIERFETCEATIAPIYNISDIIADEHFTSREAVVAVEDDDLGEGLVQNTFPKFSETPGEIDHLGPGLGSHNEEIFGTRLSYDEETRSELTSKGVI